MTKHRRRPLYRLITAAMCRSHTRGRYARYQPELEWAIKPELQPELGLAIKPELQLEPEIEPDLELEIDSAQELETELGLSSRNRDKI